MPASPLTFSLTLLLAVVLAGCLTDDDSVRPDEPPPGATDQPIILYSGGGQATSPDDAPHANDRARPIPRDRLQDPETSLNLCQLPETIPLDDEGFPIVHIAVINKHPVPISASVRVQI